MENPRYQEIEKFYTYDELCDLGEEEQGISNWIIGEWLKGVQHLLIIF